MSEVNIAIEPEAEALSLEATAAATAVLAAEAAITLNEAQTAATQLEAAQQVTEAVEAIEEVQEEVECLTETTEQKLASLALQMEELTRQVSSLASAQLIQAEATVELAEEVTAPQTEELSEIAPETPSIPENTSTLESETQTEPLDTNDAVEVQGNQGQVALVVQTPKVRLV